MGGGVDGGPGNGPLASLLWRNFWCLWGLMNQTVVNYHRVGTLLLAQAKACGYTN